MSAIHKLKTYDATARKLAFPLGGIGTGNVSLGSRGNLLDWEISNHPDKGKTLPNTFFALRIQVGTDEPMMRVVEGPIQPPYDQSHGFHPNSNAGLPRFSGTTFRGQYPFAWIEYHDPDLPISIQLEAYTPLIPLNPEDSGIPCGIFSFSIKNRTEDPVAITLVGSLLNPVGGIQLDPFGNISPNTFGKSLNQVRQEVDFRGLFFSSTGLEPDHLSYGNLSLVTLHPQVSVKPVWLRGRWYDYLREFWNDLRSNGRFTDLSYPYPPEDGRPDTGSLGLIDTLSPGARGTYRFILTWFFPNRLHSWRNPSDLSLEEINNRKTRNNYAARFEDAWDVARYVVAEMPRLETGTRSFHNALFSSTFPSHVLDALSANIVPLRSPTCFWLEDGSFFGWEGCFDSAGCCGGSCTHVWSYAHTLAYLFPSLEREMRRLEFEVETGENGFMNFRNFQSLDEVFIWGEGERPEAAVDGQMGSILRAYREWLLSGDKEWLQAVWPGIKRAIAYASNHWDSNQDGVLDGKQHNTYDIEFYGPNPLCGIYYLAALRAVGEMASLMEEPELANRSRITYERGRQVLDSLLWNGEYYIQLLDDVDSYPYQHGTGCLSDQLLGQLHARILGLGHLLPANHIRTAVKSIFKHNFHQDFHHHTNFQRTYILNDESGLILCTWPKGGQPRYPFVYSDEVWTGIEYSVAAQLIYEGFMEEGLRVVQGVRNRHDGHRRNPWNEVECGHHYARSMSSWTLLLALSGFYCDLGQGEMGFDPVIQASPDPNHFKSFWSNGKAWGTYSQIFSPEAGTWQPDLEVIGGNLSDIQVTACGMKLEPRPSG